MNQLVITLKGEVQSSNFAEWKNELIAQIQSVNTNLITDNDYVEAHRHVKLLKSAERSLKDAKQSSINQLSDIQMLFAAIDEISEQARRIRLSLERQINVRKAEIKQECVQSGIDRVQAFIDKQSEDFQLLDHAGYVDRHRFEVRIKGKASVKGIQSVIDQVCHSIETEVSQRAAEVTKNGMLLDTLPNHHKVLFQDRQALIALRHQELQLTLEKRIALFNEENARRQAEQVTNELQKIEKIELNTDPNAPTDMERQTYKLIIDIFSSRGMAIEIARSISKAYGNHSSIVNIRLSRNYE